MNIPMVKVPTFTMTLPHTGQEVKFRPYVVREEKLLIMAKDSDNENDMLQAVGDIVRECTFGAIDIDTAPMFDVQFAFLQIRGKSIGEQFDFVCTCSSCSEKIPVKVKIDEFTIKASTGHTKTIKLDENLTILMKYPTIKNFLKLYYSEGENAVFEVVAECIDTVYSGDEVFKNDGKDLKEFMNFLENLTVMQFEKLEQFFITMPIIQKDMKFICPKCGGDNQVLINGISNFFG